MCQNEKNVLFALLLLVVSACSPTEDPLDPTVYYGVITFSKPVEQFLEKPAGGSRIVLSFGPIEDHKMDFGSVWRTEKFRLPKNSRGLMPVTSSEVIMIGDECIDVTVDFFGDNASLQSNSLYLGACPDDTFLKIDHYVWFTYRND